MDLTAQTTRSVLTALAVCLVIVASADQAATQVASQTPERAAGSVVHGVVTYSDTGRPLRSAKVVLIHNETSQEMYAVTDWHGQFVVAGVPAGRYVVVIDSPGIVKPQSFRRSGVPLIPQLRLQFKPDVFTEVMVNGTDTVDVKVQAVRGGVITGRVVTDDDQPLPQADIKLLRRANGKWLPVDFTWDTLRVHRQDLVTDASGAYRIAGLPAGDYLVRVSEKLVSVDGKPTDDDVFSNGSMMMVYYPSATSVADAEAVTVVEGSESTGVDIRLPPLTPYAISGKVLGPDNEPGSRVPVRIDRTDEVGYANEEHDVVTWADNDGNWRVPGVPAGEYVITLGGSIEQPSDEGSRVRHVAPKRLNVRVTQGDVVVPDTRLSAGASISGKITLDGKTAAGSFAYLPQLVPADAGNEATREASLASRSIRRLSNGTDVLREDGTFTLIALPPGKYWLRTSSSIGEKFYLKAVTRKGVDLMQTPIKLKDDGVFDEVVVSLATDFASIEGQIAPAEGQSKRSLADTIVVLAPATDATRRIAEELVMVQADAQGKFIFTCPPGEYFVTALTPAEIKKLRAPITREYFKDGSTKFTKIKLRGGDKLKGLTIKTQWQQ